MRKVAVAGLLMMVTVAGCSKPCGRGMVQTKAVKEGGFAELGLPDDVTACMSERDGMTVTHYKKDVSNLDDGAHKLEAFMASKGYVSAPVSAQAEKAAFEAALKGKAEKRLLFKKAGDAKRYSGGVGATDSSGVYHVWLWPIDCADSRQKDNCAN